VVGFKSKVKSRGNGGGRLRVTLAEHLDYMIREEAQKVRVIERKDRLTAAKGSVT